MSGKITNEYKTFLLDPNHHVARDEYGHEGYGRTAEAAQHSLEEAQAQDVTFVSDSVTYGSSDPDDYDGFQARSYRTEQDDESTGDVSADSSDLDLSYFDDDEGDEDESDDEEEVQDAAVVPVTNVDPVPSHRQHMPAWEQAFWAQKDIEYAEEDKLIARRRSIEPRRNELQEQWDQAYRNRDAAAMKKMLPEKERLHEQYEQVCKELADFEDRMERKYKRGKYAVAKQAEPEPSLIEKFLKWL